MRTVLCIAEACNQADAIVERLRTAGFIAADLSILLADRESLCLTPNAGHIDHSRNDSLSFTLNWLGMIEILDVRGVGAFLGAGPVMATLRESEASPGITRGLMKLGLSPQEATRFEGRIRHGAILIGIQADDPVSERRAQSIFEESGGEAIQTLPSTPRIPLPEHTWPGRDRRGEIEDYGWTSAWGTA